MRNLVIITVVALAVAACATGRGSVATPGTSPKAPFMAVAVDDSAPPVAEEAVAHVRTDQTVIEEKIPMSAAQQHEKLVSRAEQADKNKRNLQINKGKYGSIMRMNPEFMKQEEDLRLGKASNVKAYKRMLEMKASALDFCETGNQRSPVAEASRVNSKVNLEFMKAKQDLRSGKNTLQRFQNPAKNRMNCADDQCRR